MVLKIGKSKLGFNNGVGITIIIVMTRILLDKCYIDIISPSFSYDGLEDHHTSFLLLISWIILILSILFVKPIILDKTNRISNIIITVMYLLSFVPFTTCIYVGILDWGFIVCNSIYWIMLLCIQLYYNKLPVNYYQKITLGKFELNDRIILLIGLLSLLLVVFISAMYTQFRMNFNLFSVYELRAEALSYKMPTIIVYAFSWTRAINPILLGYCIENRKKYMAMLFLLAQLLSFGIDGLKSTFFMIIIAFICVILCRIVSFSKIKLYTALGIMLITSFTIVEKILLKTEFIAMIFTRRMMIIPNYLSQCYYDFFKSNPYDYFRGSFLRYFGLRSPYDNDGGITMAIGSRYFRYGTNCNNGLVADAMTNIGLLGIVIMPIILCFVLRMLDKSTLNISQPILLICAFYIAEILIGTFLTTALITHGLIIIIFITGIMHRDRNNTVHSLAGK